MIDTKDPLAQLEASKSSIEDFFKDILNEMKGFKYQIPVAKKKKKKKKRERQRKGRHRVFSCLF